MDTCQLRYGRMLIEKYNYLTEGLNYYELTMFCIYLQKKHPSALSMFEDLMVEAKAKQVVVFLDYDGTLSPIVEDPDRAYVSDDVCQHLHAFPDKASFSEMPCTLLGSNTSLGYLL